MNGQDGGQTDGQVGSSGSKSDVPEQNGSAGSTSALCGNGLLDPGEQCDPNLAVSATCESLGVGTGVVSATHDGNLLDSRQDSRSRSQLQSDHGNTVQPINWLFGLARNTLQPTARCHTLSVSG